MSPESYAAPKFDVPTIQVSTEGEYVPCIDEIVKQIQSQVDYDATPAANAN
jgi:hypothetical protein